MVVLVVVLAGLVVLFALGAWKAAEGAADRDLDMTFLRVSAEARATLSSESMAELTNALAEASASAKAAHRSGMNAKQARRMGKRRAIQHMVSAIEIERMFTSAKTF